MIVNPQFFNYRLIIGSLIVGITFISVFSFKNYETYKAEHQFLEQEKNLIENELSQMILRYDTLSSTSQKLTEHLNNAKKNAQSTLEKFKLLKGDFSVMSRLKTELSFLKSKNSSLFETVDSVSTTNQSLERDNLLAYHALDQQKKLNNSLLNINASLKSILEKGALLTANSFEAKAYKSDANTSETKKAAHAQRIEVNFTLAENALATHGAKDIYIQILNPLNNVIADKGAVEFGKSLLIYSDKQVIDYENKVINVRSSIKAQQNDIPFPNGTYYVSVFHNDRKLGGTEIVLN